MDSFKLRHPTLDDIQRFTNGDDLIYILEYKNKSYPIFNDEYGSQCYIVINGKSYGGGTFNTNYLEDFKYLVKTRDR